MKRAVLAYSGGLDTSVTSGGCRAGYEVHAVAVDVGQQEDRRVGAGRLAGAADARRGGRRPVRGGLPVHAIKANGLYEGKYPMVSGLARPLIVEEVVNVAREIGADVVAHGCTGKGNDQVRFEVSFGVLAPDLEVLAPIRDANIPREKALVLAEEWGIPLASIVSSYPSTRTCGAGLPSAGRWRTVGGAAGRRFARTAPPGHVPEFAETSSPSSARPWRSTATRRSAVRIRALDLLGGPTASAASTRSRTLASSRGALRGAGAPRSSRPPGARGPDAGRRWRTTPLVEQRWTDLCTTDGLPPGPRSTRTSTRPRPT
jgi:hypothetical protein